MSSVRSSGVLAASKVVASGRNYVASVIVGADGTNAATVNIYDGLNTSGTKILSFLLKAGESSLILSLNNSIVVDGGIYVEISGTGASATVLFGA